MTKAHSKIFDKLRRKQVNSSDVLVVSYSDTSATFFLKFPGLYVTYDHKGNLVETETKVERRTHGGTLANFVQQMHIGGEVGQ